MAITLALLIKNNKQPLKVRSLHYSKIINLPVIVHFHKMKKWPQKRLNIYKSLEAFEKTWKAEDVKVKEKNHDSFLVVQFGLKDSKSTSLNPNKDANLK